MTGLHPAVAAALAAMEFLPRYEGLSRRFSPQKTPTEQRLVWIDGEEVMEIIAGLGYKPSFDSKEKFFRVEETRQGPFSFGFHILLRYGRAEFVWVVRKGEELLLGSPWSAYSKKLAGFRIPTPVFGTYEDLEEILKTALGMYGDFQRAFPPD